MPTLDEHPSSDLVKLLLMGNSGVGKTGSLASLAQAGYRLFIYDFDNGLDILLDPTILDPMLRRHVHYKLFQDKASATAGRLLPQATAWKEFTSALGDWKEDKTSLGSFRTWGKGDVLVIDSITMLSDAAMAETLAISNRLGGKPQIQDYGAAMESIQSLFEILYSSHCNCNVIVTSHLQFQGDEYSGTRKAMPSVLGNKLGPKIPRYFNSVVLLEKTVVGNTVKRRLKTVGTHHVDLKVSKPGIVPPDMEPDLGKLFAMLRGGEDAGKGV